MRFESQVVVEGDVPNKNKHVYPTALLKKIVDGFTPSTLLGSIGMNNQTAVIQLNNVSHMVTKLTMDGNNMVADIETLNTPQGKALEQLTEHSDIVFRLAGIGAGKVNEEGNLVIDDSYKMVTINALNAADAA